MKKSFRKVSSVAIVVRDTLIGLIALGCLGMAVLVTLADKTAAGALLFSAGVILTILSSLGRFKSFKGLGVEAKMNALDIKIDEADKLLRHIRNTSALMAEISFQVMSRIGRWDGTLPKKDALAIVDGLVKQLKELGAEDAQIEHCMQPWHEMNMLDLSIPIQNGIAGMITIQNQEFSALMQKIPQPIDPQNTEYIRLNELIGANGDYMSRLTERFNRAPHEIAEHAESIIRNAPHGTSEEKNKVLAQLMPKIEDAKFYLANKTFRDREKWLSIPYGH